MTNNSTEPTPPDGLPPEVATTLSQLSPEELRSTIVHAQELLRSEDEATPLVEPQSGEDIIRVTEQEGYTEVVKQFTCSDECDNCPYGPYLFHVTEEARPEGGVDTHWKFIGKITPDPE